MPHVDEASFRVWLPAGSNHGGVDVRHVRGTGDPRVGSSNRDPTERYPKKFRNNVTSSALPKSMKNAPTSGTTR